MASHSGACVVTAEIPDTALTGRQQIAAIIADALGWDWEPTPEERIPSAVECCLDPADALLASGVVVLAEPLRELHQSSGVLRANWEPMCCECGGSWPCPTRRLLDGETT